VAASAPVQLAGGHSGFYLAVPVEARRLSGEVSAGLLDEIVVQVAPVMLGDGVRLFDPSGSRKIKLEKTRVAESGQLTDLSFRVLH
jgi:hypothetical protein